MIMSRSWTSASPPLYSLRTSNMAGIDIFGIYVSSTSDMIPLTTGECVRGDRELCANLYARLSPAFNMFTPASKVAFVAKLLFTLAATFIRLSLISFYYRLVKDSGINWFRSVLHASAIWTMAVCVTFLILTIWLCSYVSPGGAGDLFESRKELTYCF